MASEYNVEVQDHEGNVYHPTPDILSTKEELMANNDAGKTPDALLVKQLNSDFDALTDSGAITGMDAREDGVYITYVPADGADAVTRKLGEPTITAVERTGTTSNGIYFDVSSMEGFENFVLYQNLFPVGKSTYSSHTGATVGITIKYDNTTGKLTMTGSSSGKINNGTLYVVQW